MMPNDRRRAVGAVCASVRIRAIHELSRRGWPRALPAAILLPAVGLALLMMSGCASSGTPALGTPSTIEVLLTQEPASPLEIATVSPMIATVLNDSQNMGVDWQVSCSVAKCGTFSPTHTASGAVTMFTAPSSVPSQLSVASATVNLTAISVADPTKSVTVTLSVTGPPISVAFSAPAPPATLQTNSGVSLNATILNDVASAGADWTVTCAGTGSACGTLNSAHTSDTGTSVVSNVYVAPSAVPAGGGYVTITVTATADKTKFASATIQITTPPITVTFSQVPSTVSAGSTASMTATVANDPSNKGVSWSVSCGSSSCGSFNPAATASGTATTYTAPATPPTGSTVTVKATSVANATVSVTSIVTITAPQAVSISYSSPPPGSLQTGAQASVIATVSNDTTNAGVDWSVTCGTGSTSCGSFSLSHTVSGGATTFTAPLTSPSDGEVTITATATATEKSSSPATAVATVTINGAGRAGLLLGQYAFSLSGTDSRGFYAVAGSVILDGNGNVTSGEQDFADTASVHPTSTLTGSYEVGNDGRGTMTLTSTDTTVGVNGVETLDFVVVSSQQALVIEFDTSATSNGNLVLQTPSSFSLMSVNGGYSFTLAGVDLTKSAAPMDVGGVLTADGLGNFSGIIEDVNDAGTVSSSTPTGTYTLPDAFGRGTATLGSTATYAYYVVNSGVFKLLETNSSGLTVGSAFTQSAAPSFTAASLSGPYAFTTQGTAQGTSGSGALAIGGLLSFDGNGDVTSGTMLDVNNAGTVTSGSPTGTYTVASNGRSTVTLSTATGGVAQFALYLTASQGPLMLELDSGLTSTGAALAQASSISAATFKGSYAGLLDLQPTSGEEDAEAEVTSDGVSALSGTMDLNDFKAAAPLESNTALTGSFTANSNGRFTGSFSLSTTPVTNLTDIFYVANSSTVLFIDIDAASPGSGQLQLQQFTSGPAISIAFTTNEAPPATMQQGATATMAATVTNDTGQGVNWTVSCSGSSCGSFNPSHTASGATTTYTAPDANVTVTITATAVADQTQHVEASVIVGSGSPVISIAFTAPPPSTLQESTSAQITATVSNDPTNAGVNWSVTCGGTSCGSFTPSSGNTASGTPITYTAPSSVPTGNTVTITAAAAASPSTTVQGITTITTTPPPPPTITISAGPSNGQLQTSSQWSYSATVMNDSSGVNWSVSCSNGSDGCGSFTPSQTTDTGSTVYTAPDAISTGSSVSVTLTASLVDAPSVSAQESLTIVSAGSPGLLGTGWFTFHLTGSDSSTNNSVYALLGSVYLNGSGGITAPGGTGNAGEEDYEDSGNVSSQAPIAIMGGSYVIGPDGRGTMTLNTSDMTIGVLGVQTLSFAVTSTQHALITQFDGTAAASGSIDQQGMSLSQASVTGAYSFLLFGIDVSTGMNAGGALGLGGVVTANGAGAFSGVTEDLNDGGTVSSSTTSGTFTTLDSYGRGTATLGGDPADCSTAPPAATFVFYIVDGTTLRFLQNDNCGLTSGSMYAQGASLATGPYAFTASGAGATTRMNAVTAGGVFTLSGNAISAETIDVDNTGTLTQGLTPSGSYTNPSSGRFTLNFGTLAAGIQNFAAYLTSADGVLLLETDGTTGPVSTGTAFAQTAGIAAIATGNYAADSYGVANTGSKFPETVLGQIYSNGNSLLAGFTGVEQLGQAGSPFANSPFSGTFMSCASGRCTGTLGTTPTGSIGENFYLVSSSTALFMETDTSAESTGQLQGQTGFQVPPEVVITSPPAPSVQLGAQTMLTAVVTNDLTNAGVNWTLNCSAGGSACGTITANTQSGAAATYTAPATLPGSSTYLLITITGASANNPNSTSAVQVVAYSTSAGELAIITEWPSQLLTGSSGPVSAVVINDPSNTPMVIWSVSCGGTSCGTAPGTIASGAMGFYTAPASIPAPTYVDGVPQGTVTLTVAPADVSGGCTATPDPCTSESTTITGNLGDISASWLFAPPATLYENTDATVEATISGANDSNPLVTYSCAPTGSCGTFTAPGGSPQQTLTVSDAEQVTYTAPGTTGTVTITATSVDDPNISVTGSVMIQSPGLVSLLKGQYAISFSGTQADINATGQEGYYAVLGSLNLNGLGGVTSGEEDYYVAAVPPPLSGETNAQIISAGSNYTVNADGTGTLTLETVSPLCLGVLQENGDCLQTMQFVVVNTSRALVVEFDNSATSDGSLDLQSGLTSSGFPLSSITGAYVFTLFGVDNSIPSEIAPFGLGGAVTANPSGFSWSGTGDSNDDGAVHSDEAISGGYNNASGEAQPGNCGTGGTNDTDPCGRSSATIVLGSTTYNIVYYVVNQNYLEILDVDGDNFALPFVLGLGGMYSAANPAQLSTGNYVFTVEGTQFDNTQTSGPPVAAGGIFTSPGGASGDLSAVTLDVDNDGKADTGCAPTGTTTFSIGSNGRGTLTFGTNTCAGSDTFSNFGIYATSASGPLNGGVLMLQLDTNSSDKITETAGTAYPQASSPSFSGTYGGVFDSIVTEPTESANATEQDVLGQITASSSSICSGGSSCGMSTGVYINQANVVQGFGPYSAVPLTGSFTSSSNGRYVGSVTITVDGTPYALNEIFYAGVNGNNTVLSLETDKFGTGSQSFQGPGVGLLQIQNLNDPSQPRSQYRAPARPIFALPSGPGSAPARPENPRGPRSLASPGVAPAGQ